jgi:hypothetical protein
MTCVSLIVAALLCFCGRSSSISSSWAASRGCGECARAARLQVPIGRPMGVGASDGRDQCREERPTLTITTFSLLTPVCSFVLIGVGAALALRVSFECAAEVKSDWIAHGVGGLADGALASRPLREPHFQEGKQIAHRAHHKFAPSVFIRTGILNLSPMNALARDWFIWFDLDIENFS